MSKTKIVPLFVAILLCLLVPNAFAFDLGKFDPVLAAASAEADASGIDPATVMVEVLVLVDGSFFGAHEEQKVRALFASSGLSARSVIFGNDIIVTAAGSLAAAMEMTDESAVRYFEGSRIMFPEPSVSVGN